MRQSISLVGPINSGISAGGAGVSTNNADSTIPLNGLLMGVYVRYNDAPPAGTTDVTIKTKGTLYPSVTLLTISNAATDGYISIRKADVSTANAATGSFGMIPIMDYVNVKIDQANDGDSVDVWFMLSTLVI